MVNHITLNLLEHLLKDRVQIEFSPLNLSKYSGKLEMTFSDDLELDRITSELLRELKEKQEHSVTVTKTTTAPQTLTPIPGTYFEDEELDNRSITSTTVTKTFTQSWLKEVEDEAQGKGKAKRVDAKGKKKDKETPKEFLWRKIDSLVQKIKYDHVDAEPLLVGGKFLIFRIWFA